MFLEKEKKSGMNYNICRPIPYAAYPPSPYHLLCALQRTSSLGRMYTSSWYTSLHRSWSHCAGYSAAAIHQVSPSMAYSHITYILPISSGLLEHLEGGEGQLADMGLGLSLSLHCGYCQQGSIHA